MADSRGVNMKRNFGNIPSAPAFVPVAKTDKVKYIILSMSKEDEPDDLQKLTLINTLFFLVSDDASGVTPPERSEQLEQFHMLKVCSKIYEDHPTDGTTPELERLEDNLRIVCGARAGEYLAEELRFC